MKSCSTCGEIKEFNSFHKQASNKSGYRAKCKKCTKQESAEYLSKNRDAINTRKRQERIDNPERVAANKRRDYEKHKDKRNAKTKEWYNNNKKEVLIKQKIQRAGEGGRALRCKHSQLRALRIRETSDGSISKETKRELYELQDGRCYLCDCDLTQLKKRNVHLDHIIPLSKGGKHIIDNVAWACATCNLSKADNYE